MEKELKWDELFDHSSSYKMLYSLQIVAHFLLERGKQQWIANFFELGGFKQILGMFKTSQKILIEKRNSGLDKFEKRFIETILLITRDIVLAANAAQEPEYL